MTTVGRTPSPVEATVGAAAPRPARSGQRSGACFITAVSLDARTAAALPGDGRAGVVHSAHERVINVVSPDGHLFCLATSSLDDAPRTVRLPDAAWPPVALHPGDPVRFLPGRLRHEGSCGASTIAFGAAIRWQPTPADLTHLTVADLHGLVATLDTALANRPAASPFDAASQSLITARLHHLEVAIRTGNTTTVATVARGLIGLGTGLTPTGDDILTGLAVLAATPGIRLDRIRPALRAASYDVHARTTAVSAATLLEAVDGRGRQRLHDLLAAMGAATTPDPAYRSRLDAAIAAVRAIGHTSGTDILTGVRLGLHLEAGLRERATPINTKENR